MGAEVLQPAVSALRAVEDSLASDRVETAWVDLDIAALRLSDAAMRSPPAGRRAIAIEAARHAVEHARDLLGRAQVGQACAAVAGAVLVLVGV
jgi:hypothetical protein